MDWGDEMAGKKYNSKKSVVLHHLGSSPKNCDEEKELMESFRTNSIDSFHYVVKTNGSWIQLVDDRIRAGWNGGHYVGDEDSIHVVCVGNFSEDGMEREQFDGLSELLQVLMKRHKISHCEIIAHSTLENSDCPGKYFPLVRLREKLDIPIIQMWKNSDTAVVENSPTKLPEKLPEYKGIVYVPAEWICKSLGFIYENFKKRIEIRREK